MVIYYDDLRLSNVVSKHYTLTSDQLDGAYRDFLIKLTERCKLHLRGPLIYTIDRAKDELFGMWLMMPVEEGEVSADFGYRFDSYISIENVVCCRLLQSEMEQYRDTCYDVMERFCNESGLTINTHLYFVLGSRKENPYYLVKAGCKLKK